MMLDTDKSPLIAEFLKDHQQFSRLLFEIKKLLAAGRFDRAKVRAQELNRLAGPHIAYEELELYPRLAVLGERQVTQDSLVHQHHDARDALVELLKTDRLDSHSLQRIQAGIDAALKHAEHCGSLISLMNQLSESEQAESLQHLIRLRKMGQLWTELTL